MLKEFIEEKKDAEVFVQTKDDTKELLGYIKENYKKLRNRLIVEVASLDEYDLAKELGFKNIVYRLASTKDIDKVIKNLSKKKLKAISLDASNLDEEAVKKLVESGHKVYAYLVNDSELAHKLFKLGVTAIYTEKL